MDTAGSPAVVDFNYDCNGNVTTRVIGGTTYTLGYNVENMLTSVSGGASASFVYDGDGQRVKGTVAGVTTVYIGDHYEWIGSTSTAKRYYAGGQRIAERVGDSTLYFLLGDHLGSTSITANSSGGFVAEVRYTPWGETRYVTGTTPTTFRYTGQRQESGLGGANGLYDYGARWLDPYCGTIPERRQPRAGDGQPAEAEDNGLNYIGHWYDRLLRAPQFAVRAKASARGKCEINREPHSWIAAVAIEIHPSTALEVEDTLATEVREYLQETGWYDQIIYGVLDVMLTVPESPARSFRLVITGAEIHPIHASGMAFRLAAREAAKQVAEALIRGNPQ